MEATNAKSTDVMSPGTRRKKPVAAILALLCDLAAWLLFPSFWDEDPWVALGALMISVLLAGSGAVVAALGMLVSAGRARHDRPRPSGGLGLIALTASILSIVIFIATFNWFVVSAG